MNLKKVFKDYHVIHLKCNVPSSSKRQRKHLKQISIHIFLIRNPFIHFKLKISWPLYLNFELGFSLKSEFEMPS